MHALVSYIMYSVMIRCLMNPLKQSMTKQLSKQLLRSTKKSRSDFLEIERNQIYVVLDNLKCAHNIGTILRLSDATLVKKVYICGDTIIPPNRKIKASSRGAEKWVTWEYRDSAIDVVRELKTNAVTIVSAEIADSSQTYDKAAYSFPLCLVFGREYDGVSEEILDISDVIVHLPIYGMSNSLNVSLTASVIIYEALKASMNLPNLTQNSNSSPLS